MFWNVRATPASVIRWGSRPDERASLRGATSPAVERNTPVMQLNNVVLPAPFGPMIPKIWPRWTVSDTPLRATTPPNCMTTSSRIEHLLGDLRGASDVVLGQLDVRGHLERGRSDGLVLAGVAVLGRGRDRSHAAVAGRLGQLGRPLPAGQEALRAEDHHHHEGQAEQEEAVLGDGRGLAADDAVEAVEQPVAPGRVAEVLREEADGEGAGDDARGRPEPAEDHGRQEEERQVQGEGVGVDEPDLRRVDPAAEAAGRCADGEGPELHLEGGHAHELGRVLVLADGGPGPADPRAVEPADEHDGDDDAGQHEVHVGERLGAELQPGDRGGVRDARDAAGLTEAVAVQRDDAHDLAEAERDDGEVVASEPQGRAPQHDAGHHRQDDGDEQHLPRGERAVVGGELGGGVGADGEEGHVAEVEHAGLADDDVQPEGQQDVDADGEEEHALPVASRASVGIPDGEGRGAASRTSGLGPPAGGGPSARATGSTTASRGRRGRRREARRAFMPGTARGSRRAGRSVGRAARATRTTNAKTSFHSPPNTVAP